MTALRGALIGSAFLLATAASSFAQTGPNGPYVRVEGGLSHPGSMSDRSAIFTGGSANINRDEGFIGGIAGGYQLGPFRAELNADYSRNGVDTVKNATGSSNLAGNTANLSFMLNGLYDINLGLPVVPYIGAGVGATDFRGDNVRITSGAAAGTTLFNGDRWGLAIQPIVGVSYSITPQISVAGEYRYLYGVDEVHVGTSTLTNREHHFLLSATWHFGSPAAPPPAPVAAPPAPPPAAVAPQKQVFIVFFEFDKSALTPDGKKVVDAAAAAFKSGKSSVAIAGYTDLAGTQQYNLALSKRRAETVAAALVRDGVPRSAINANWYGKQNPRVPTADGVREPQNRRVEITM